MGGGGPRVGRAEGKAVRGNGAWMRGVGGGGGGGGPRCGRRGAGGPPSRATPRPPRLAPCPAVARFTHPSRAVLRPASWPASEPSYESVRIRVGLHPSRLSSGSAFIRVGPHPVPHPSPSAGERSEREGGTHPHPSRPGSESDRIRVGLHPSRAAPLGAEASVSRGAARLISRDVTDVMAARAVARVVADAESSALLLARCGAVETLVRGSE